jgi:hypothetical protein
MTESQRSKVATRWTKWISIIIGGVIVAGFLLWRAFLWLDASYYVSRFQQKIDEQCPNRGIVVSVEGYSNDLYPSWSNDSAACYRDPNSREVEVICRC